MNITKLQADNRKQYRNVLNELKQLRDKNIDNERTDFLEEERNIRYLLDNSYNTILKQEKRIRKNLKKLMNR